MKGTGKTGAWVAVKGTGNKGWEGMGPGDCESDSSDSDYDYEDDDSYNIADDMDRIYKLEDETKRNWDHTEFISESVQVVLRGSSVGYMVK